MAQTWQSQVILFASSPEQARASFREAGFFERNSSEIDARKLAVEDVSFAEERPGQIFPEGARFRLEPVVLNAPWLRSPAQVCGCARCIGRAPAG